MRISCAVALSFGMLATVTAQEFLEDLGPRLTFRVFDDNVRARISGTLDLEYYRFEQPAPALIFSEEHNLLNPRLTMFFDAQAGAALYFFSQARFDRGFDPSDRGAQIRLDEYALRITPWKDGRFSLQFGKFATVIGNWVGRHLSWDNPFINAPLVYENVTPLEDKVAANASYHYDGELHDEKYEYIPVIWGPSYTTGASVAGRIWKFEYAAEVKNAALSSRPESWDATRIGFEHPTVSGRLGFRPNEMWNLGVSASDGAYLRPEAEATFGYHGGSIGDYHQKLLAQDISFAWHHLQIWAELHEARFEVPGLGDADTFAYYIEAKYKFLPQLFGAVRWGQQFFDEVTDFYGDAIKWSDDISRIEAAISYRFTEHTQLKLQYWFEAEDERRQSTFAAQFTVRF